MTQPRVLITNHPPDDHLSPLLGVAEIIKGPPGFGLLSRAEVLAQAADLDAIIANGELRVDAELLDAAPRLRIVANVAMGTDSLDKPLMAARGVWATNTPESFIDATADCALALLLALVRRIPAADTYVRSGRWPIDGFQPSRWEGSQLAGKTLGIVGYGRIGQATARRARAFGMAVVHHNRTETDDPEWRSLPALLAVSDVVALHCPLTPETRGLIDASALAAMRPGTILLNLARGPVVVESDLVAALQTGHLAGAGLDVFEAEPQVHPALLGMENVVLTPHIGGGTIESRSHARQLAAANVARVLTGHHPLTPVNTL